MGASASSNPCKFCGVLVAVVDPVDQCPFDRHPTATLLSVTNHGFTESVDGVALVDRDEFIAQPVISGMERDCERDWQRRCGQLLDTRDYSDGGHGDRPCGEPKITVEALDSVPCVVEVGEWFAHPHEHHVRDPPVTSGLSGPHDLFDDLTGREVPVKTSLPRRTKTTGHRAPCLGTDTYRGPVGIEHKHGFDLVAVVCLPQPFQGLALIRMLQLDLGESQRGLFSNTSP